MKIIAKIMCVLLLPVLFLAGCNGDGTFRQNIGLSNNKVSSSEVEKIISNNIYDYDVDNDFNMTSASQAQLDNPINDPDPTYYANKYVYNFLGTDTMPIGGYIEPEYTMLTDVTLEQWCREFVESGCNILVHIAQRTHATSEHLYDIYAYLEQYGGMILRKYSSVMNQTGTLESGAEKIRSELAKDATYKSFAGLHVIDEPGWKTWTEGTTGFGHEVWNAVFNSKLFFINLLPIYSPGWSFPNGATGHLAGSSSNDYDYYYSSYVELVKPKVFCYDYYPLKGSFPTLKDEHFLQLYKSRYYAQDYNDAVNGGYIPFWSFIQISGFAATRQATYAEIAWQINTAVTFGCKGLQYYVYSPSGNDLSADAGNPGTPVTIKGYKTDNYWNMQRANNYIQSMAKWFLNAEVDHIGQVGFTPNGEIIHEDMFKPRDPSFQWRLVNTAGAPHLVSYMKYYANNNNYDEFVDGDVQELYFVCNNSIVNGGDVTLNFGEELVSGSYIVSGKEYVFEGTSLTVSTGAGEAFAVLLDK